MLIHDTSRRYGFFELTSMCNQKGGVKVQNRPLLFVLCFLFSAKGDGDEFREHLREVGSAFAEQPFGRCELSKRQDWCLEAAFVLSGVVSEVLAYTCMTRKLGPNTLRDSVFQRLELIHFDAYIHVCATM